MAEYRQFFVPRSTIIPDIAVGVTIIVASILSAVNFGVYPGWRFSLLYGVIYFWALFKPNLLRFSIIIAAGLLTDAIIDLPIGFSVGELWLLWWITLWQRRLFLSKGFSSVWIGFIAVTTAISLLRFLLLSWAFDTPILFYRNMYDIIIHWLTMPLLVFCLGYIDHWIRDR